MKRTRREIEVALEIAGTAMSNILFNVAQRPNDPLEPRVASLMETARRAWDRAYGDWQQINHLIGTRPGAPPLTLDIDQVRKDYENGTLICRATIGQLIAALSLAAPGGDDHG